jgi:hypothetical protein
LESLPRKAEISKYASPFARNQPQQGATSAFYSFNMADDLFNDLTKILRERDIPYDRDTTKSALNDPESQTAIREWMEEYLAPETLLTKNEATL